MESGLQINIPLLVAVSAVQVVLGALFGWMVRGARAAMNARAEAESRAAESRRMNEVMHRMHELTGKIGENVGQHSERVQAINEELAKAQSGGDEQLQDALLTAMAQIAEANERLQGQLKDAENKLTEQTQKLEYQMAEARTDALTGLPNRRAFDDELARRLGEYLRYKSPFSLMLIDIDHFKKFNDTHGHLAGDEVLKGVARTLFDAMREVDVVCRYGGEEFAVIFPATTAVHAVRAAERGRQAVDCKIFDYQGTQLRVTVSEGLTDGQPNDDAAAIIKRADEALYASKRAGRNRVHLHDGKECLPINPRHETPAAPAVAETPAASVAAPTPAPSAPAEPVAAEPVELAPADRDELTGLATRHVLMEDMGRRIAQRKSFRTPFAVLVADVDELQAINERFGQNTGDVVLRAVSQFLTAGLHETDLAVRTDGDRFFVLLHKADQESAIQSAERIRHAIERCKLRVANNEVRFSVSLGVAEATANDDSDELLRRVTEALHAAKLSGRNCTRVHTGQRCEPIEALVAVAAT